MSHQQDPQRRNPPLAGRPPWATDEDDEVYEREPVQPTRRLRQDQPKQDNSARDSTYQAWDNYLQPNADDNRASGVGGIGMGLLASDVDDDSDDERIITKKPTNPPANARLQNSNAPSSTQPLTRPPPAAVTAPLRAQQQQAPTQLRTPPHEIAQPAPRQANMVQRPAAAALRVDVQSPQQPAMPIPRAPIPNFLQAPASPAPSLNPHPLNAPSTPITPVFARPSLQVDRKVEFSKEAILRGNSEETLLPRGNPRGEDFWRRFSVVAKTDQKTNHAKSNWLKRYEGGNSRMSKWVWCMSVFILLLIGGAIGFGWYMTHNEPPSLPVAVGGSENQSLVEPSVARTTAATSTGRPSLSAPLAVETKRPSPAKRVLGVPKIPAGHHSRSFNKRTRMYLEDLD